MDVDFRNEPGYARARYSGPWSVDELIASVDLLADECRSRKRRRLIIDWMSLESKALSVLDRYRLGSCAFALSEALERIAVATPGEMIDPEKFGERVARNRGVNLRVFPELEAARLWLLAD
ncbi:MAG TPA: hypothetical protein VF950_05945 [Planctomycetota bacterium]